MLQSESNEIKYPDALTFPFKQDDWLSKMWWVFLVNFLPIPFFNLILIRGWRVNVIKRMVRGKKDIFPNLNDLGRMLADGFTLWVMTGIYAIPEIIILTIFGTDPIQLILDIGLWLLGIVFAGNTANFSVSATEIISRLLFTVAFGGAYYIISWPIYRAAMVRFSASGSYGVFFDIPTNIKLVIEHLDSFMLVFFLTVLTQILVAFISGIFIATFFGAIFVQLISIPFYYWTTAALYGQLAVRILPDRQDFE